MDTTTALHYPDFETFSKLAAGADLVPVYRRLVSDALTPVTAFHKIDAGRCACLFESVVGGEKVGRYSFLATEPFFEIEAYGNRVTTSAYSGVSAGGTPTLVTRQFDCPNPLDELRRRVEAVARCICRSCRRFAAARSDTRATTRCDTSSGCRTPRPTTARCPTWPSPSTTRWWCSTT